MEAKANENNQKIIQGKITIDVVQTAKRLGIEEMKVRQALKIHKTDEQTCMKKQTEKMDSKEQDA